MLIEEMTWKEYSEKVSNHIIVLPIGALDPHGQHLSMDTDTVISLTMAKFLASRVNAMILPPIAYGCKSHPIKCGGRFPGATNLRSSTMINLILDILRDSYEHGARKFLVSHAHMANLPIALEAIDLFVREANDARVMAASWWDFASEDTRNQIARETSTDRTVDHHAAMVETSLMLYMAPERVKKHLLIDDGSERKVNYLVLPTPEDLITKTGVVYNASSASREIGERLTSEIIDSLVDAVKLELG